MRATFISIGVVLAVIFIIFLIIGIILIKKGKDENKANAGSGKKKEIIGIVLLCIGIIALIGGIIVLVMGFKSK